MRIVVTRPEGQEADLVARLEQLGHEVVHCPLIAIEALGDGPIDVSGYDWVVVTSANGARELRRRARPVRCRASRRSVRRRLTRSEGPTSCPLSRHRKDCWPSCPVPAGRVLFAAGEGARSLLPDTLAADVVVLYRTRELSPAELPRGRSLRASRRRRPRERSARSGGSSRSSRSAPRRPGRRTAAGLEVVAEAEHHSSGGIAAAVAELPGD